MRHRKHTVKFGRQRSHYKTTMRSLVSGLIINKSISTTKVRAKETSRLADKLVTIGKQNSVVNQRKAYRILRDRGLVSILFNEIAPLFKDRNGGYTRVMLTNKRRGDNAQMAILEFVEKPKIEPVAKKEKKQKSKVTQPEPKARVEKKVEKKEKPKVIKPKKQEIIKKEEPKKEIPPSKEHEKSEEPKKKPSFFKRLFGRKKD